MSRPTRASRPFITSLLIICASPLMAQVERATISGTVRDPSGAVVASAVVAVTNANTGVAENSVTNQSGEYVVPNLIPGIYTIRASASGFKTTERAGIELHVNERVAADMVLSVGEVNQQVEVQALAPLLESESSTVDNVITRREVSELPLNGRSIYQLAYLNAGVTAAIPTQNANNTSIPDNARAQQGLSVNGQRQSNNTFILDGVYNNQINQGLSAILPPLEAVQEFVVETANFLPEIGRGGGVVNVTLKSGTNAFHGNAFEFLRNSDLDARNFFDYTTGRRLPNFVQNQFGGSVGGPIVKNHTFFFADYQGFRQRQGQSFVATVPDGNIRTGNFAGTDRQIFDPGTYNAATNTRQPFPDNMIPASDFNPAALNVLKFFPAGGGAALSNGEQFFYSGASRSNNQDSFDVKIDQYFGEKDQLAGRFSLGNSHTVLPGAFSDLPQYSEAIGGALTTAGAGLLTGKVSNPARSLGIQEIHNFNPSTINEFRVAYVRAGSDAVQLGYGQSYASQLGIPNVNITSDNSGFPQIGISGFSTLGDTAYFPLIELENVYQWLDNVTFIRGSHTYKAGVDAKRIQRNFTQILGPPAGSFSFGPNFTADPNNPDNTGNAFADFLLGIPTSGSIVTTSGLAGIRSTELSAYFQDTWKISPRLTLNYGLRYDLFTPQTEVYNRQSNIDPITGKLVLPNGGGSYPGLSTRALVSTNWHNFAPRFGFAYRLGDKTVIRSSYGIFFFPESQAGQQMTLNPPFVGGSNFTNTPEPQQIVRTLDQGLPPSNGLIPIDNPSGAFNGRFPENHTAYSQQWTFGVQHQLTQSVLVEVNYVGNNSIHLQDQFNLNQPYPGTGNVQVRRPYYTADPNLTDFTYVEQRGVGNYEGLQISLKKRFSKGFTLLTDYTFSKAIENPGSNYGDTGHQNARDLDADRGLAGVDVRNRWVSSLLYELPFGHNKPLISDAHGVLNSIVGGWQLGAVSTVQSGLPFTISGGAGRPNRVCNGETPPGGHTVTEWFDTSCFPLPAAVPDPVHGGVYIPFGNAGANILTGPGIVDLDLSAFKSFVMSETKRLEFRSEWFNSLNHPNFLNPSASVGTGTFGEILNAGPSRQIQMALKFIF